jgi:hypothetical protein
MVFVQITHGAPQVGSDKQKLFELLFLFLVYSLSHAAATKRAMRKSARDRSKDRKGAGDRGRSSGYTSKEANGEDRREPTSLCHVGTHSSCAVAPLLFGPGLPWAPFGGPCFGLVGLGPRWALPALGGWGPVGPCLRLLLGLGWGFVKCVSVGARYKQRGWLLSLSLQKIWKDNGLLHVCEKRPCGDGHIATLHVKCAQLCTQREADQAVSLGLGAFDVHYWRKVVETDFPTAKKFHARWTGGLSLTSESKPPSATSEDSRRGHDREEAKPAPLRDASSSELQSRLDSLRVRAQKMRPGEAARQSTALVPKKSSAALAQLSSRLGAALDSASGEAPSALISGLISGVIAKLEDEAGADAAETAMTTSRRLFTSPRSLPQEHM